MKARIFAAAILAAGSLAVHTAQAQQPAGIKRTDAIKADLGIQGREVVQVRVDFAPGASFPRHAHPGEEVAYVLEGVVEYTIDGKPPVTLKAGDALLIPAGAVHTARNPGSVHAAELATYIIEKGKPALTLAK